MKKLALALAAGLVSLTSQAITLFPFFVDVAGDYQEGAMKEFAEIGAEMMYSSKPTFYNSLDEAKSFYKETMPFSTEKIILKDLKLEEGKGSVYISPMLDGVLSIIYLFETPDKVFYIGYDEKKKPASK